MRKVTETTLYKYVLREPSKTKNPNIDIHLNKIKDLSDQIDSEIEGTEKRLEELKEAKRFIASNPKNEIYLFKSNDSEYFYMDADGELYDYSEIKGKPIIVNDSFQFYEITGYIDLESVTRKNYKSNSSSVIYGWIDKLVEVKKLS